MAHSWETTLAEDPADRTAVAPRPTMSSRLCTTKLEGIFQILSRLPSVNFALSEIVIVSPTFIVA